MTSISATSTTGQAQVPPPLRSAFSLTTAESLLAFVFASGAWFAVQKIAYDHPTLPVWWPVATSVLSLTLAASAVSGWRALRYINTRHLSRSGYIALAFPAVEAALYFSLMLVPWPDAVGGPLVMLFLTMMAGCLSLHWALSLAASLLGLLNKGGERAYQRGDMAVFPLCFAFYFLLALLMTNSS